jgi:hypothetical protein
VRWLQPIRTGMEGHVGTDRATRARIAAMTAAEAAIEQNALDPYAALEQTSAAAAQAVKVDPETVYQMAGEIVVRVFRGKLDGSGSLEMLCISCGAPVPDKRLLCRRCEPEFLSDDEP